MDNKAKAFAKLSATSKIVDGFVSLCEDNDIDPHEAWKTIGAIMSWNISNDTSSNPPSRPEKKNESISLSPDQAKKAKEEARAAKAKRLSLSVKEVNLTDAEVKEAKRVYRLKLLNGEVGSSVNITQKSPPQTPKPKKEKEEKEVIPQSVPPKKTSSSVVSSKGQPPAEASGEEGLKRTLKTRVKQARQTALRSNPAGVSDPSGLHLVAYLNARSRLQSQYGEFKKTYGPLDLSPMRFLPDPWKIQDVKEYLNTLIEGAKLRPQSGSPNTFVLQRDDGASFWQRDMPDPQNCPLILSEKIPPQIISALESQAGYTGDD